MASLSTGKDGKRKGLHRVMLTDANGKRQQLYLGRMPKKTAEGIYRCIEDLERATVYGSTPADFASRWLTTVSDELHERLVKFGLTQPRASAVVAPTVPVITLDTLIERYKARPKFAALADGTKVCHHYSFVRLREFFGAERDITTIMETDAEDMVAALGENFAEATVARIAGAGSMLLRFGVRSRLLSVNPFDGVKRGSFVTPHKAYVDAQTCRDLIDECPDLESKLVVAFARFAGLRTPSEPRVLLWKDVDWSGRRFRCDSPKTGPRVIPIVPEVMQLLEQQFEAVPEGTELVLPGMAISERTTYSHRISRIVDRLNLERWPRLFHSLRASRQTDWNEVFPAHVTALWMGNSPTIGDRHYNRMLDGHFDAATRPATQHPPATARMKPQSK
jgi:integrase